jgi:diguanylate cyclase (GGDEF)-like protein
VLHEDCGDSHPELAKLRHAAYDLVGHEVEAPRAGAEDDPALNPHGIILKQVENRERNRRSKDSPLRERLRSRRAKWNGVEALGTSASMARIAAFAWAAGALFALVSVLLPEAAVNDETLLAVVAGVAAAAAVALFVVFDRVRPWGFQVMLAGATVVASAAAYAWGSASAYEPLPYMWITLFAFYFFSLRAAVMHMALVGAGYAIALAAESPPGDPLDGWLATLGTLLVSGMFVLLLRGRMVALVARLGDAAHRDALTELLNRRGFDEIFDIELERARRSDTPLSLLLGDLDHFKRLNDEFGHAAGDAELRRVARTFRVAKRRFDIAARVGGEEFALLAPDCDEQGAYLLAERMRAEVDLGPAHGDRTLTISFGVATFPLHGESVDALLRAADRALYAAKDLGRNRSVISDAEPSTERTRAQSP